MKCEVTISRLNEKRMIFSVLGYLYFSVSLISCLELFVFSSYRLSTKLLVSIFRLRTRHVDVHFLGLKFLYLLLKHGQDASYEGGNGWERCLFPARFGFSSLTLNLKGNLSYLYLDLACKNLDFSPMKGYK